MSIGEECRRRFIRSKTNAVDAGALRIWFKGE